MGIKRASFRLDPALVAKAIEMRRAGQTIKAIAQDLGCSPAGLHPYLVEAGLVTTPAATAAEDDALTLKLDDLVDTAATVAKGILGDFAKKLRGKPGAPIGARELGEARKVLIETRKLAELLRGRATARTATVKEEEPTPEERAQMERMQELLRLAEERTPFRVFPPPASSGASAAG